MVAGHERHAIGGDARVVKDLGESLEFTRCADFGEVTRDDDVVGADAARSRKSVSELALAKLAVQRSPEAQEVVSHRVARPSPARTGVEHVHIG